MNSSVFQQSSRSLLQSPKLTSSSSNDINFPDKFDLSSPPIIKQVNSDRCITSSHLDKKMTASKKSLFSGEKEKQGQFKQEDIINWVSGNSKLSLEDILNPSFSTNTIEQHYSSMKVIQEPQESSKQLEDFTSKSNSTIRKARKGRVIQEEGDSSSQMMTQSLSSLELINFVQSKQKSESRSLFNNQSGINNKITTYAGTSSGASDLEKIFENIKFLPKSTANEGKLNKNSSLQYLKQVPLEQLEKSTKTIKVTNHAKKDNSVNFSVDNIYDEFMTYSTDSKDKNFKKIPYDEVRQAEVSGKNKMFHSWKSPAMIALEKQVNQNIIAKELESEEEEEFVMRPKARTLDISVSSEKQIKAPVNQSLYKSILKNSKRALDDTLNEFRCDTSSRSNSPKRVQFQN